MDRLFKAPKGWLQTHTKNEDNVAKYMYRKEETKRVSYWDPHRDWIALCETHDMVDGQCYKPFIKEFSFPFTVGLVRLHPPKDKKHKHLLAEGKNYLLP